MRNKHHRTLFHYSSPLSVQRYVTRHCRLRNPTLNDPQGFLIGTWYLDGTELHIEDLLDPGSGGMRYSFQMILDLRSRPLGRWNRLDLRTYDSVHLESGEATPLALKNERPFWFSKVRSYA